MDKIYNGFSLNSNQFSIHQAKRLLKKELDVRQLKTDIFKINPSLSDYSGSALWDLFETVQEDKLTHIVFGKHNQRGYGTFVSTDKRLIFIDAGNDEIIFKEVVALEDMSSIDFSPLTNIITVTISSRVIEITLDHPQYGLPFCEAVRQLINNSRKINTTEVTAILDLVERLGKLRQSNILTEEEFLQEKAKLFSKI
ncbi:MAG: PH domain-containing protein [Chryseobacterium jejuense]